MAPPTLCKPALAPPRSQANPSKQPKTPKTLVSYEDHIQQQPALVGVTSSVVEEYDPCRPNDYEEYKKERKRIAKEAELRRELERRQQVEEDNVNNDNGHKIGCGEDGVCWSLPPTTLATILNLSSIHINRMAMRMALNARYHRQFLPQYNIIDQKPPTKSIENQTHP